MSILIDEHPFAEFIKILGKGKKGARNLTQQEAYRAMTMIVTEEQVEPEQLGAFLMLMRIKEETPEELAGFVQAARDSLNAAPPIRVDLDWSSYAGKRRHLPWFILSVLLLAQQGIRVFMHGASGQTQGRLYTESVLKSLGIPIANSLTTAAEQLQHSHFSYLPLNAFCAKLNQLIDLRELLGLRSAVHTVVRLLNPFQARCTIQGIFHPNYRNLHQQAALLLEQPYMSVFKGEGGEIERNPDVECLVQSVIEGQLQEELWPALFQRRHLKPAELQPIQLQAIWSGETTDEFAQTSIIGTAAIALKLLGMAENQQQAYQLAENYWQSRQREKFLLNSEKM